MKRGKKLDDPARKQLAGTYRNCVDDNVVTITPATVRDLPVMPDWLTDGAKQVWSGDIERIAAVGSTAIDSSAVALYCETMAVFIAAVRSGQPVNAAYRSELRKQMELLGIAGAKSRLARVTTAEPAKPTAFSIRN